METLIIQNVMPTLIIQAALAAKSFALRETAKALLLEAEAVKADGKLYKCILHKAADIEKDARRISKYLSPKDWEKETADDWGNEVSAAETRARAARDAKKAAEILREHAQFMDDNDWAEQSARHEKKWNKVIPAWDKAIIAWDRAVQARKAVVRLENVYPPANP